jgi:cytochrome oxidase assembly protein ShyY1
VRFLFRPGWLALTVAVFGFAFACYYLLAPWQFHRSDERDGANTALSIAVSDAPVPRASLVPPGSAPSPAVAWRQVLVSGIYDPAGEVLVRLRSVDGGAANEVMTPLRTADGQTLLVDRGYVRPGDDGTLPPIPAAPAGPVALVGYQRLDEETPDRPVIEQGGHRQVYAASAALVGHATGVALAPGYVQLQAGQPGVLTAVPLPPPDPNSSYSYAWQWLIFGVMAVGAWAYFVRLEYRTRRGLPRETVRPRTRLDPRDHPDGTAWDAPHDGTEPAPGSDEVPEKVPEKAPADRYGRR